jgi:periplasmic divalent cation tolerance protein
MMIVVLTTVPDAGEGEILAEKIVGERLAACVQVLPAMTSVYFWEGKVHSESEHLLLIKTVEEKFEALSEFISANHSYEVPEIVAIPAVRVSETYLGWVREYLE